MSNSRKTRIADWDACPCAGVNLDRFIQPAALAILAGGDIHGYRVVKQLGQLPMFGDHAPDATGVYRFLKMMEKRGLVESAWDVSKSGPAKKVFRLTLSGRDCLKRWRTTLAEYHRQVGDMMELLRLAATRRGRGKHKNCTCKEKS